MKYTYSIIISVNLMCDYPQEPPRKSRRMVEPNTDSEPKSEMPEELRNFLQQVSKHEGLVFPKDIPIPNHVLDQSTVILFTEKYPLDLVRLDTQEITWWFDEGQYAFTWEVIYSVLKRACQHKRKWQPDSEDRPLSPPGTYHSMLNQSNPWGFALIDWYGAFFKWLPPIYRLEKEENRVLCKTAYLNAIQLCWLSVPIMEMPGIFIDEEIVNIILEKHPLDVTRLPLADMNYDLAYRAVRTVLNLVRTSNQYNPNWYERIFQDCPNTLKDTSLCQEAYSIDKVLAVFMPEEQITYQMVEELSLMKGSWSIWNSLDRIPMKYRDYKICQNYVTNISGINIKYVPDSVIDQHLCDLAFEQNANSFNYIPIRFRTYSMCLAATKRVDVTIAWLEVVSGTPVEYRTEEFWDSYHIRNESFKRFCDLCNQCRCKLCLN